MEKKPLVSKVHDQLDKLEMDTRKAIKEQPDKGKFLVDEFTKRTNDIGIDGLTDDQKKEFKQAVDKKVKDLKALAKSLKENRGNKVMEKKTVMEAVDEVGKDKNITGQDVPMGLGKAGDMCDCVHAEVDVTFADAVNQDKENRERMGKMWKDMEKDAKDITPKDPEAPMKEKNMFTEKLTLDESLFEEAVDARDDIDAKRDDRLERAKVRLRKVRDDADAQRDDRLKKQGLKESDKPAALSIKDAQKWVDYDMKRYGKISDRTNRLVKKAGFQILKDDHGDYEVAAGKFESVSKKLQGKRPLKEEVSDEAYKVADMIANRFEGLNGVSWNKFSQALDDGILDVFGEGVATALEGNDSELPNGEAVGDFEQDVRGILGYKGWETIYEGPNEGGLQKTVIPKTDDQLIHLALSRLTDRVSDLDLTQDELDRLNDLVWEYEEKANKESVYEVCKRKSRGKKLTEAPVYGLQPQYDARQSFYGKAQVDTGDKGDQNKLYSYNTLVAEIKDGKPVVYGTFSATTLRHIKEWLKQNGFKAENSRQIMADYGVKEECAK